MLPATHDAMSTALVVALVAGAFVLGACFGMLVAAMARASAVGDTFEERLARWGREDVRERASERDGL